MRIALRSYNAKLKIKLKLNKPPIITRSVMHNYLNLVLHVDSEQVKNWTTLDVLSRWKLIMLLSKINHAN